MNLSLYIRSLLESKTRESACLEYKAFSFPDGRFSNLQEKQRNNLLKEICSFANTNGGEIIIGIGEDDDHNPSEFCDTGINEHNFEVWEQAFRLAVTTRTRPALRGLTCAFVQVTDGKGCILITIPSSVQKPHAFNTGSNDEFYIRYGNITHPMSYDDLKHSFLLLEGTQAKVRNFRDKRLAMLLNQEIVEDLNHDAALVLHVIPEWSLDDENYLDVRKARYNNHFTVFSPPDSHGNAEYNADGLMMKSGYGDRPVMSYIQVFHNGSVEASEFRLLNDSSDGNVYRWNKIEDLIAKKIYQYCNGLVMLGIPHGFYMFLTLLNMKGKRAVIDDWGEMSPIISRDIIKTKMAVWNSEIEFPLSIMPMLNSAANAFGVDKSTLYNGKLEPIKERFAFFFEETTRD